MPSLSDNKLTLTITAVDEASKALTTAAAEVNALGAASDKASKEVVASNDRMNASNKQAKTYFDEGASGANSFSQSLSSTAHTVASLGIALAGYQIVSLVQDFASSAVSAAGQLEQTNMAFQTLIGNVGEANSVFAQLVGYANTTPFESKDIVQAAQTLMGFGTAGQQTVDLVKQLGDVTAVTSGDLNALSLVTGQIFSQGKMRAQDMYQIINDGGAGLVKIMAANAGGMAKLTAEFDAGGVPAKAYFDAINQATANGGFAFQGALKQAGTFNGQLSTLQDSATQFGMALLGVRIDPQLGYVIQSGGLFDRAKGIIGGLSDALVGMVGPAESVFPALVTGIRNLYVQVGDYLGPKFGELYKQLNVNVVPTLKALWQDVIVPLVPVVGRTLVGAIGGAVDVLTGLTAGLNFVINGMKTGNPVIWGLVTVFGALASVMAFNAVFDAITVGFATFRLITIPSMIASWEALQASSAGVAARMILTWTVAGVRIAAQGVAAAAVWVAQAVRVSTVWVVTELPKIIASFALVAARATLHAADVALAWTLNAVRVSTVWVVTEMPKLIASFVVTSAAAVREAAVSSAAWIANATRTSFAWVVNELPKIIASFVLTSGASVREAAVTSAAWVGSAAASSFAWVVNELPKIVAAFLTTSAAAIVQAGVASAAWVSAAVTSTESWTAFQALVASPITMGAIAVAGALADIALVAAAVAAVIGAIQEMKEAAAAQAQEQRLSASLKSAEQSVLRDPKRSMADKQRAIDIWHQHPEWGAVQFATGTSFAPGGLAIVGEQGPELVDLPRGAQVHTAADSKQIMSKQQGAGLTINGGMHIYNNIDEQKLMAKIGLKLAGIGA